MSERKNLKSTLLAAGFQLPGDIDLSVLDFLNDAVTSDTLSVAEKTELLCDTLPSMRNLGQSKVEEILHRLKSLCEQHPLAKVATPITVKEKEATKTSASSSDKIVDEIKHILDSRSLEGADIVEVELVEYLLNYLEELVVDVNDQLSGAELDGFKDLLTSFFTEIDSDSEALQKIATALLEKHSERRAIKIREASSHSSSSSLSTSNSNSSSKSRTANVVVRDELNSGISEEERADMIFLASMMPHTSEDIIYYVFKVLCGSNRVEAGQYLVERSDDEGMAKLRESKFAYDKKEWEFAKQSAIQMKKMKDRVCVKYGETLVSDEYDSKGIDPKKKTLLPIQFVDARDKDNKVNAS